MCDRHSFQFNMDKAYEDQLVAVLEDSPQHPLADPDAPLTSGVYVLYRGGCPVYVGQTRNLHRRLRDSLKKTGGREGIGAEEVACRFLVIGRLWEVARAEDILIRRYGPEWNRRRRLSTPVAGMGTWETQSTDAKTSVSASPHV